MTSENADSTEPTINIDEAEMEVTLHLAGRIAVYVYDMSKRMGICPQEYLRFVIGSVVTKGMFIPGNDDPMLPMATPPPMGGSVEDNAERVMGVMQRMLAMTGQLTCQQCTQRLGVEDVKQGHCRHCEAPIDV